MNKTILTCYLIDSSGVQRHECELMIEKHFNLKLLKQFANYEDALAAFEKQPVDLLISEADLGKKTVFDLLDAIEEPPFCLIIANKQTYAFQAFAYNVVDYMAKPLVKERFLQAVDNAVMAYKLREEVIKQRGEFIFVKCNLKRRKVYLNELKYVEALGDYVKLITREDNLVVLSTMKAFELKLPANKFMRIHKSYIVNLEKIDKFNSRMVELEGPGTTAEPSQEVQAQRLFVWQETLAKIDPGDLVFHLYLPQFNIAHLYQVAVHEHLIQIT